MSARGPGWINGHLIVPPGQLIPQFPPSHIIVGEQRRRQNKRSIKITLALFTLSTPRRGGREGQQEGDGREFAEAGAMTEEGVGRKNQGKSLLDVLKEMRISIYTAHSATFTSGRPNNGICFPVD
uniref:Uncharacterized protein n=1 Tax=Steinernema glaseri TaxID=37863 RepID=A0A1I7ZLS0_9BILA